MVEEQQQKRWFSTKEAAVYISVSVDLLQKWRSQGIGIDYIKLGDSYTTPRKPNNISRFLISNTIK